MIIHKAYKFRLKPTQEQVAMLFQHGGNTRFLWNKLVEYANDTHKKTNKYPVLSNYLQKVKQVKSENDFLKISYSQPLQINAIRMSETITKAFKPEIVKERNKRIAIAKNIPDPKKRNKALAKALNYAFPNYKKKSYNKDSIFYPQHFLVKSTRILFPKLGWINYIKHRPVEGKIKTLTITQDGEQWFVSIMCEVEIKEKVKPSLDRANIVGMDVGSAKFGTISDKTVIENPRTLKKNLKKLRRANKKFARQQLIETDKKTFYGETIKISSKNRIKQVKKLQRIHRKIRNIRKDFLHNITNHIINTYDGFVLEKLNIQEMLQKNGKALKRYNY